MLPPVIVPVAFRLPVTETLEKVPDPGVVPPIAPGAAKLAPPKVVALIAPEPLTPREPPVPTTNAWVFVPAVIALKAPPAPLPLEAAVIRPLGSTGKLGFG